MPFLRKLRSIGGIVVRCCLLFVQYVKELMGAEEEDLTVDEAANGKDDL